MVLEQKMTIRTPNARQHARNGLGLIYRDAYNDLDRSDLYYEEIKQSVLDECTDKVVWDGIADSHLGYNMFLRGAYTKAIPLLKRGLEKTLHYNEIAFAVIPAINLAHTYLKTGEITLAKHYIDLALDLNQKRS
jgi:tetratricopeptide (TPR) repeat protein